ncbi:winged helix DNA-binding domain-containing protein [Microbacterium hydrocarbonoxydans]|nr:winged helix DNA-binding domain-containing protein [Microbacterium hydrocarbonoxydans]
MKQLRGDDSRSNGWSWGPTKEALEHMVWTGDIVCVRRRNWHRLFDLPERALPAQVLNATVDPAGGLRRVVADALRCLGVATADDVADYLRLREESVTRALHDIGAEQGRVHRWDAPVWVLADSPVVGGDATARAVLVNPFDNLVWHRPRLQALFPDSLVVAAAQPLFRQLFNDDRLDTVSVRIDDNVPWSAGD